MLPIFGKTSAEPQWQSEPDGRGTTSLLQTCILTIALCVYSAIHLNVPAYRTGHFWRLMQKAWFVILALFAPEIVAYFAWAQRADAKAISEALNNALGLDPQPSKTRILWQWIRKQFVCLVRKTKSARKKKDADTEQKPDLETALKQEPTNVSKVTRPEMQAVFCNVGSFSSMANLRCCSGLHVTLSH